MEFRSDGFFFFGNDEKLNDVGDNKEETKMPFNEEDPLMDYVRSWGPDILKAITKHTNLPISEIQFNLVESNEFAKNFVKDPNFSVLTQFLDMCDSMGNFEYTISSRRQMDDVMCYTENYRPHVTRIHVGSNAEGFRFRDAKLDVMIVPQFMKVFPSIKILREYYLLKDQQHCNGEPPEELMYAMHTDDVSPGYSRLFRASPNKKRREETESWNIHDYFSAHSFQNICNKYFLADQPVRGSQCASVFGIGTYNNIFCLHCNIWPPQAEEWPYIKRENGWPTQKTIDEVIECGCYLVPICSNDSTSDSEWRITFSTAEKVLVHSMEEYQFKMYGLLRIVIQKIVRANPEFRQVLPPYIVLTVVFRILEALPSNTWCEERYITGFYDCIEYFVKALESKIIRHYFLPGVNLFNFKVPHAVVSHLVKNLVAIRTKSLQFRLERSPVFQLGCREVDSDKPEELLAEGFIPNTGIMVELLWDIAMYKELRLPVHTNVSDATLQLERAINLRETVLLMPEVKRGFLKYLTLHLKRCKSTLMLRRLMDEAWWPPTDEIRGRRVECLNLILDCHSIDVTSGRLAIATSYYMIRQYKETVGMASQAMEMFDWLVMYADHDDKKYVINSELAKEYERMICGKSLRFGDKVRGVFAFNVTFPKKGAVLPPELKMDLIFCKHPLHLSISPIVYGRFILFLCHFKLKDENAARKDLRKLEGTLTDRQHNTKPHINLNMIGHCYILLRDHQKALNSFRKAYLAKPDNHASLWHALITIFEHHMYGL